MKKKVIIIVIVLVIILLGGIIGASYLVSSKNTESEKIENKDTESTKEESEELASAKKCQLKLEDIDDYTTYLVETFEVDDERILSSTSSIIMVCKSKEVFEELQSNEDFKKGRTFSEDDLTIEYPYDKNDYTKDESGNELTLKYQTYTDDLKNIGYECTE
jgi:hypothetical protein